MLKINEKLSVFEHYVIKKDIKTLEKTASNQPSTKAKTPIFEARFLMKKEPNHEIINKCFVFSNVQFIYEPIQYLAQCFGPVEKFLFLPPETPEMANLVTRVIVTGRVFRSHNLISHATCITCWKFTNFKKKRSCFLPQNPLKV